MGNASKKKKVEEEYPEVEINDTEANRSKGFPNNRISTTKYTPLTFLPKNLFEQFRYDF